MLRSDEVELTKGDTQGSGASSDPVCRIIDLGLPSAFSRNMLQPPAHELAARTFSSRLLTRVRCSLPAAAL
eukprot:scaffold1372_cov183-Isochrysis_galbana.AAC.2